MVSVGFIIFVFFLISLIIAGILILYLISENKKTTDENKNVIKPGLGEPCLGSTEFNCAAGLSCSNGICKTKTGQPCNIAADCLIPGDLCVGGTNFICWAGNTNDLGTFGYPGSPDCDLGLILDSSGIYCLYPPGVTCGSNSDCASNVCSGKVCSDFQSIGNKCNSITRCNENLFCDPFGVCQFPTITSGTQNAYCNSGTQFNSTDANKGLLGCNLPNNCKFYDNNNGICSPNGKFTLGEKCFNSLDCNTSLGFTVCETPSKLSPLMSDVISINTTLNDSLCFYTSDAYSSDQCGGNGTAGACPKGYVCENKCNPTKNLPCNNNICSNGTSCNNTNGKKLWYFDKNIWSWTYHSTLPSGTNGFPGKISGGPYSSTTSTATTSAEKDVISVYFSFMTDKGVASGKRGTGYTYRNGSWNITSNGVYEGRNVIFSGVTPTDVVYNCVDVPLDNNLHTVNLYINDKLVRMDSISNPSDTQSTSSPFRPININIPFGYVLYENTDNIYYNTNFDINFNNNNNQMMVLQTSQEVNKSFFNLLLNNIDTTFYSISSPTIPDDYEFSFSYSGIKNNIAHYESGEFVSVVNGEFIVVNKNKVVIDDMNTDIFLDINVFLNSTIYSDRIVFIHYNQTVNEKEIYLHVTGNKKTVTQNQIFYANSNFGTFVKLPGNFDPTASAEIINGKLYLLTDGECV